MQNVTYSCTALLGVNKTGVIKPDENGYYTIVLGALNVENSSGSFYPYEEVKGLFHEGSSLLRRIADGSCRAEYGHPKRLPGMTNRQYLERICEIEETKVCAHITSIELDFKSYTGDVGEPIVVIIGKVKPQGPYADCLAKSLENPGEAVAFSIRSITEDKVVSGVNHKYIKLVVTWDYVNEPGIDVSRKWNSPSLESHSGEELTVDESFTVTEDQTRTVADAGTGIESGNAVFREVGALFKGTAKVNQILRSKSAAW